MVEIGECRVYEAWRKFGVCSGMECVDSGGSCGVKSIGRVWRVVE